MLGYARVLNKARGDLEDFPLQAGEVVRLRIGGPKMEVEEVTDGGWIKVVWAGRSGEVHRDEFRPELLRRNGGFFHRRRYG